MCARGLDIKHIRVVVNYACPNHAEDYVHRVGRTGRAGSRGTAYTFITPEEGQYAGDLVRALENSGSAVPDPLRALDEAHQQRIAEGDVERKKGNVGFAGKGFDFSESETNKVKEFRKELSRAYGLGGDEPEGEDDEGAAGKSAEQREEERRKVEDQQILTMLERDPQARKVAMEAGNKASTNALKQGLSHEEATRVAQEAMLYVLRQYRPATVTLEKGLESVL